jgi:hypothetical protein
VFLADNDAFMGDYGINNFYFYRFTDTKLFTFIPWDKSEAFSSPTYSIWHNITGVPRTRVNHLMAQTLASQDLLDYYLEALMECVRSAGELAAESTDTRGWLEREIGNGAQQIREATLTDRRPFPTTTSSRGRPQDVRAERRFRHERGGRGGRTSVRRPPGAAISPVRIFRTTARPQE